MPKILKECSVSQKMFSVCQSVSRHVSLYLRHELNVPDKELHRHPLGEGEGGRFKMLQQKPNPSYLISLSVTSVEFTSIQMQKVFMCRVSKRLKARVGTDIENYFQESNSPLHLESRSPQCALGILL